MLMTVQIPASHRLGTWPGVALLMGAVLGPGVLVLPHLAAASAGPASVLAWAGLLMLSVPVALSFAALGARYPDGGGVATFAGRAFGARAAAVAGWWFYCAVPVGVLAAALIGGDYVAAAAGGGRTTSVMVAGVLLAGAFAANHVGLRTSSRLQLGLVALLVALLAAAIVVAVPRVRASNFTPFAPHGALGVAGAAGVLLFAFLGWEAASHLSAEFADRERGLVRATLLTLAVVGVLYVGLSVTSIGVLGGRAASLSVPLTALLSSGIGGTARPITGVAAVLLSFGPVNTYLAGAGRLGAALARDGVLPGWFARGAEPGRTPHRSLGLLAVLTFSVMVPVVVWGVDLDTLMRATAACLAAVTVLGTAAAVRLLPRGAARLTAVIATVFAAAALLCCGGYLVVPAGLGLVALLSPARSSLTKARTTADPASSEVAT
jgi:amino acid efflux transporter